MKKNRHRKWNFCYGESSVIFPNHFLCRRIKFREKDSKLVAPNQIWYTFRFASSNRILFGGFKYISTNFPSSILKYFLLVFLVFIILIFAVFYPCVFFWFFLLRIIILQNKASVAIESDFFFWWSWRANNIILIRWYKR